jgi:hypothetical protein
LSASIQSTTTAKISPEFFEWQSVRLTNRTLVIIALTISILIGFGFRVSQLGAESLGEDEFNKLMAVADYRANGITAANGEHPMLMKAAQTFSIVIGEKWNAVFPSMQVSTEAALRFPNVLLGALTSLLLFIVFSELFGTEIGLLTAIFWAFDPSAIGFNRIAKEDTFLLFFFLLANVFWLRGQRVAERQEGKFEPYCWAAGACFGAMLASKYLPHFLGLSASYYYIFQGIPQTRWRLGKIKWLIFFVFMGVVFVICNPAILLPDTWKAMRAFASEKKVVHDSYEYIGELYRSKGTLWLKGIPWHFYYVFTLVKIPLITVIAAIIGVPFFFRKRMGDGRYFIFLWLVFWFMPFSVIGGKFTRYFTVGLPVVFVFAAVGLQTIAQFVSNLIKSESSKTLVYSSIVFVVLCLPIYSSASFAPHYRLYTNIIGGGHERAGDYFPHDEFYDASTGEISRYIAATAKPNARVANETPSLYDYYFKRAGRTDLRSILLSDKTEANKLEVGDVIVIARGRRYFNNDKVIEEIKKAMPPTKIFYLGSIPSAEVFVLEKKGQDIVAAITR